MCVIIQNFFTLDLLIWKRTTSKSQMETVSFMKEYAALGERINNLIQSREQMLNETLQDMLKVAVQN